MKSFFGYQFEDGNEASSLAEMLEVFEYLKPKASPKPLIRIGSNRDGSYLLPDDLENMAACFSPGVDNFKYFEDKVVETYGIDCHMCDYSSDVEKLKTPLIEGRQTFAKKWLSPDPGEDNIELADWIGREAPEGDLLLQIDIEGAEYRNLLSASAETLSRFRIIVIEVHSLWAIQDAAICREVLAPFFRKLSEIFIPVHAHPNNCCGEFVIPGTEISIPNVLELTYLRKDRAVEAPFPPQLPHPQDVSRNVSGKPPMFLGEEWLDGPRSLESKVKIIEDTLEMVGEFPNEPAILNRQEFLTRSVATMQRRLAAMLQADGAGAADEREVAAGKAYVLSSAYPGMSRKGQVAPGNPFFFHTAFGFNQFIKVDLGEALTVSRIGIGNRLDGYQDRAGLLYCILSTGEDHTKGDIFQLATGDAFATGELLQSEVELPPTKARYVTIISPLSTALHLSDLKVFAR
ncbi:MAG: FkbM family methyltransferase [Alphaproteobacteria bacterium]|nr:FkbM family methyltransferase [Alphaproteobacteria bacterium]MBU1551012.1 FkbM family methyltransferase [Alphaproteobacteria bacterium]MBU2339148.1 FkbM family methyltransferase [Alphaproteobacteria bacterium]MBU2387239.1 FkbM family methyltransferase [Alphaproteobacteria bacterium]